LDNNNPDEAVDRVDHLVDPVVDDSRAEAYREPSRNFGR
jgi:hypothetical protein